MRERTTSRKVIDGEQYLITVDERSGEKKLSDYRLIEVVDPVSQDILAIDKVYDKERFLRKDVPLPNREEHIARVLAEAVEYRKKRDEQKGELQASIDEAVGWIQEDDE